MIFDKLLSLPWLGVPYSPRPDERAFLDRAETRQDGELEVRAAVLDARESELFFDVPLAHHGIQPVWLKIVNRGAEPFRLRIASIDPNYFPPLEAAFVSHYRLIRRLMRFGLLAAFFWPFLILLPFKALGARLYNRKMNAFFVEQGIGWGFIRPGAERSGFVFTSLDEGTKQFTVSLINSTGTKDFAFAIPIPGLKVDYHGKSMADLDATTPPVECTDAELRDRIAKLPATTTNRHGSKHGDPLNLVMIGDFDTILAGFGARWDETETITLKSCGRTAMAFLRGSRYRYSPVSPLFVDGRSQDFALQKARQTINQRLHLRLWITPLRYHSKPVWIGQVSRDIGVRFTIHTWNLTTHKIDADVDDARDYVLNDLLESERVAQIGYANGVGAALPNAPGQNLTGDPYFTDGLRAVAVFSETQTRPTFLNWA